MRRQTVYPGQIPLDSDLLNTNRNVLIALGWALQTILGTNTVVDGLACTPTTPASMQIQVAPGAIYSMQNVDSSAYGSLAADTTHQIIKQGLSLDTITLTCAAPAASGQSVIYLVQAAYQDVDTNPVTLPYYNAGNPNQGFSGPGNSGAAQFTARDGVCLVSIKAGIAAATGSQAAPAPDAGYVGLYTVTVAYGQSAISSGNIVTLSSAPFIPVKLPQVTNATPAAPGVSLPAWLSAISALGNGLTLDGNNALTLKLADGSLRLTSAGLSAVGAALPGWMSAISALGNGLTLDGNNALTLKLADGSLRLTSAGLSAVGAALPGWLSAISALGNGLTVDSGNALTLKLADTSLQVTNAGLAIRHLYEGLPGGGKTLTAADNGKFFDCGVSGSLTLPDLSTVPEGFSFTVVALRNFGVTIHRSPTDSRTIFKPGAPFNIFSGDSWTVQPGGWAEFRSNATGWSIYDYTTGYASSLMPAGWTQFPNGLILQWGSDPLFALPVGTIAQHRILFPYSFPTMGFPPIISQVNDIPGASAAVSAVVLSSTYQAWGAWGFWIGYDNLEPPGAGDRQIGANWYALGY